MSLIEIVFLLRFIERRKSQEINAVDYFADDF